jgi:type IV pilus assembly protein PilX
MKHHHHPRCFSYCANPEKPTGCRQGGGAFPSGGLAQGNRFCGCHRVPKGQTRNQRGVVLLFTLIALVILLIASIALIRSLNTSLFTAGNIGFKRDLQNQSERAVNQVLAQFDAGGALGLIDARKDHAPSKNYSASFLPTNAYGIPQILEKSDTDFAAAWTAPDIDVSDQKIKVRYVVDRLCRSTGDEQDLGAGGCVLADNAASPGTSASNLQSAERSLGTGLAGAVPISVIYRISVRVTGPRNTQSFFQSTFTVPSAT